MADERFMKHHYDAAPAPWKCNETKGWCLHESCKSATAPARTEVGKEAAMTALQFYQESWIKENGEHGNDNDLEIRL